MKKVTILSLTVAILALPGCYPGEVVTNEETDLVLTHHEEEPDFSAYATYAMPDTLMVASPDDDFTPTYEAEIIAAIERNMSELGYTRVTNPSTQTADLILIPEMIIANHYAAGTCWSCWGWGWNPWYPGWGGGYYPPYPPSYVVSYQSGTILMTLIKVDNNLADGEFPDAVWTGAINGLLRNSITLERIEYLIDQAFDQSPYLNLN